MDSKTHMAIDISIIIVSWNVRDFLNRCLGSIYRNPSGVNFEVIVVDNGSSDGSAGMVKSGFPLLRLIEEKENLGFAGANNVALKEASGRYVLFLNPDTEVFADTLQRMSESMDAHPDWSALACKLIFSDGTLQPSCRHFPSLFTDLMENLYLDWLFPRSPIFNYYRMGSWPHDSLRRVDVPYGACLMARRSVLDTVGPMDERFFMYYDEIDLCRRIKKSGGSVWYIPTISVIHHSNKSSDQVPVEVARWKCNSKILYFKKHFGVVSVYALVINLFLRTLIVWGLFGLGHIIFSRPRDLEYIKENVRATWREFGKFFGKQVQK